MSTKLQFLQPGEQFIIPTLTDIFRNLVVIRPGDCTVLVTGEKREDNNSNWGRFKDRIAPGTNVKSLGTFLNIVDNPDGTASVEGFSSEEGFVTVKRGRKAKHSIKWPENNFSFGELASQLQVPYHTVVNAFNKEKSKFEKIGSKPNGGKGKPISIWRIKK